jgi:hypothetical protein
MESISRCNMLAAAAAGGLMTAASVAAAESVLGVVPSRGRCGDRGLCPGLHL